MKRLVVVDDDELVRTTMKLYFEGVGWAVDLAAGPEQALACLRAPFEAMICDLNLSPTQGGEGLALLVAARHASPAAILVLLSGQGADDLGEARPDAVVQKPVRLPRLEKLLTELGARQA